MVATSYLGNPKKTPSHPVIFPRDDFNLDLNFTSSTFSYSSTTSDSTKNGVSTRHNPISSFHAVSPVNLKPGTVTFAHEPPRPENVGSVILGPRNVGGSPWESRTNKQTNVTCSLTPTDGRVLLINDIISAAWTRRIL